MKIFERQKAAAKRIAVALDGMDFDQASATIELLAPLGVGFKAGLEIIMLPDGAADRLIKKIHSLGGWCFFDTKLDDIPPTVENAAANIAKKNVRFFNVHASAGIPAVEAAVKARGSCGVLVVTVLTSIDKESCIRIFGDEPTPKVLQFAREAKAAGAQGIVCSALELEALFEAGILDNDFIAVTPGIRLPDAPPDDQKRTRTPREAMKKGASILVVGRPITKAKDPVGATATFISEVVLAEGEKK